MRIGILNGIIGLRAPYRSVRGDAQCAELSTGRSPSPGGLALAGGRADPPPSGRGGGAVVAVPKHLPSSKFREHTFPLTRTLPDPLPPT